MSANFGRFREANDYLDDFIGLQALYEEEGYLFFRNVLKQEAVHNLKREFVRVLSSQGVVKPGAAEAVWSGGGVDQIDDNALYALAAFENFNTDSGLDKLADRVFGEPTFISPGANIRYALPEDPKHVTPAHQDHFFIRAHQEFRTLWIPLMDIAENGGGLVIAVGSHQHGLDDHLPVDAYSVIARGRQQVGISVETVQQPWLITDYRVGDVLIFHCLLIHRALPNESDKIRLSLDARAHPLRVPKTWQLSTSVLDYRRYREESKRIATALGANESQYEALVIEMMKRDLPADQPAIQALMAEMGMSPE